MDRNDKLFAGVYEDLQTRVKGKNDYDLIKAGGLLRQLLLDNDRLIDIVNKPRRIRLQFTILNHAKIDRLLPEWPEFDDFPNIFEKEKVDSYWRNLDPTPAYRLTKTISFTPDELLNLQNLDGEATIFGNPPLRIDNVVDEITGQGETRIIDFNLLRLKNHIPTLELKRDQFLKTKCIFWENHKYSVKDLIRSAANLRGGVHQGGQPTSEEGQLFDLDNLMKISGIDASIAMMAGISSIVLLAIEPLYKTIQAN